MRDLERELDESWPESWKPAVNEKLVGRILAYRKSYGGEFGPTWVCLIEVEGKKPKRVAVWLNSTVLMNLFREHQPKPGERLGLKYLGKSEEKGYHRYTLLVDREESLPQELCGVEEQSRVLYSNEKEEETSDIPF